MGDVEGATPKEQILEACRRDNVELFTDVLSTLQSQTKNSEQAVADFFNTTTDTMGNHLLHVCASYGAYDVLDSLLDIPLLECDPLTLRDKETPIHCAVKYANEREVELGQAMAQMLVDAGGDPRVKDGHGRRPAEICTPRTEELRTMLRQQEYILNEGLHREAAREEAREEEELNGSASDDE